MSESTMRAKSFVGPACLTTVHGAIFTTQLTRTKGRWRLALGGVVAFRVTWNCLCIVWKVEALPLLQL